MKTKSFEQKILKNIKFLSAQIHADSAKSIRCSMKLASLMSLVELYEQILIKNN